MIAIERDFDHASYERRVRARIGRRHRHVWVRSFPYDNLGTWRPVENMVFCDVPGCDAVRVVR